MREGIRTGVGMDIIVVGGVVVVDGRGGVDDVGGSGGVVCGAVDGGGGWCADGCASDCDSRDLGSGR